MFIAVAEMAIGRNAAAAGLKQLNLSHRYLEKLIVCFVHKEQWVIP